MGALDRLKAGVAAARRRRPSLDHLVRGRARYQADGADRLAASVTLPGFLSFFPLLALAFFVLGFVVAGSADVQRQVLDAVGGYLPGLLCSGEVPGHLCSTAGSGTIDISKIGAARNAAGVIGIGGLLLAGTGWVDALRAALRMVWHQNVKVGNVVVTKVRDVGVLAGLGLALLASIGVSSLGSTATSGVLDVLGFTGSTLGNVVVKVVGIAVSVLVNLGLFLFLFGALPRVQTPVRRIVRGALFAAVGFVVLQVLGAVYIARTTSNPIYGTFAAVIGLLVWINVVCRFTLFCAAWTVTAPYDSDVAPSGTASPEDARRAGIPQEYADDSPDRPATLVGGGAPSPLANSVQGHNPPQAEAPGQPARTAGQATTAAPPVAPLPTQVGRRRPRDRRGRRAGVAGRDGQGESGGESGGEPAPALPHAALARTAGRVGVGVLALGTVTLLVLAGRVLLDVARSD